MASFASTFRDRIFMIFGLETFVNDVVLFGLQVKGIDFSVFDDGW